MSKDNPKNWFKEFSQFLDAEPVAPPRELGETIFSRVQGDLNPSSWKVFSKISFIQVIVGFITRLFCPQFGLSLTGTHGIMHVFMRFGETGCMFACGVMFAGSSFLISSLVLSSDEVRVLRKNRTLQMALLSLLTVGAFLCLGAQVWELLTLAWIAGYIGGGIASLELGWTTRQRIKAKVFYG